MTRALAYDDLTDLIALVDNADVAIDRFVEARAAKSARRAIDERAATLQTDLARLFRRQGNALVRALAPIGKYLSEALENDIDKWFDRATLDTSTAMAETIQTAIEAALVNSAKSLLAEYSASIVFSLTNPRAVAYTRDYGARLITGIDETSKNHIRQVVKVAIANGTSYAQLARDLKQAYKQFAVGVPQHHLRSRAELIAVTEIGNAYSEGNLIAARIVAGDGMPMEHQWLTVGDRRVSAGCRDNAAAGWIDLDKQFPSGHDRPLRFPGCRCTALYRRKR